MRTMLRGKIHRATVTGADLHYEGSVTIDVDLLERADIIPYEQVDIWNVTNGERFTTYALAGQRGSGVVCINGAAAHKAKRGDLVIIAAFAQVSEAEARAWAPHCVFVDACNHPVELRAERAGQSDIRNARMASH
jgi:aspartate 1-decarboxylase